MKILLSQATVIFITKHKIQRAIHSRNGNVTSKSNVFQEGIRRHSPFTISVESSIGSSTIVS